MPPDPPSRKLRLGFHYHLAARVDADGRVWIPGYLGRFLDALAEHCERLVCFLHTTDTDEFSDYELSRDNFELVDLGPKRSVPVRELTSRWITRPVAAHRHRLDALLIRGPSPLLPAVAAAAGRVPVALLLVGDLVASSAGLKQPPWRQAAIELWARWNQRQQLRAARRALTFVNSRKLFDELSGRVPTLVEVRTTTLTGADFCERDDACTGPEIRMLYTGRIDRDKGLVQMVEAIAWLRERDYDVALDMIGWADAGDTSLDDMLARARELGVAEHVVFHGFKAMGEELFAYYRKADVFVMASISSEGLPRSIWEAMAHSVPVVATRIGSMPLFLSDRESAMLVEPRQSTALAEAVATLINDADLRRRIVKQGFALARSNTLEARSKEMAVQLADWAFARPSSPGSQRTSRTTTKGSA